ncbi:hypothetical protein Q1695_007491 [Nippostrongylus brasiliensis]|nr:hypothetical protein Q1695_007491 [Nippostrongylus brasiliensis]
MSGGGIKDIYHFVEENLTELGLLPTRHPHWIIYCYFLVAKLMLLIVLYSWNQHSTIKKSSAIMVLYDYEVQPLSDLPKSKQPRDGKVEKGNG